MFPPVYGSWPYWSAHPAWGMPSGIAARSRLLGLPAQRTLGFGMGPAAIEPGLLFFAGGHTIGGPSGTSYRGVSASSFPVPAVYYASGAPMNAEALGFAGAMMYLPGTHGAAWQ